MSSVDLDFRSLLPSDLPSGMDLVREGRQRGAAVDRAQSLCLEERQTSSERVWRERARSQGILCTSINIGLSTWAETREALVTIYVDALSRGIRPPDHFTLSRRAAHGPPRGDPRDRPSVERADGAIFTRL